MEIRFYKTFSEKNRVSKSLLDELIVSGNLTAECSVVNPEIIFSNIADLLGKNYAYIPDFGRYYFIEDMTIINKMIQIRLHCDVLMSFKRDILGSTATCHRSNFRNDNIKDSMVLNLPSVNVQYKKLGEALTGGSYIMIVGG